MAFRKKKKEKIFSQSVFYNEQKRPKNDNKKKRAIS